ncbi:37S ribosomal protein-like protein S5 [Cryomyces antarcticus]
MSASRPARCLLSKAPSTAAKHPSCRRRPFHSTCANHARPKPAYPSVKATDMGLVQQRISESASKLKPYTKEEKRLLAHKYTPEQLIAIEAGEAAIDPQDLVTQGAIRGDPYRLTYLDDMSQIRPYIDKPVRPAEETHTDPSIRLKTENELAMAFHKYTKARQARIQAWQNMYGSLTDEQRQEFAEEKAAEAENPNLSPQERARLAAEAEEITEGPAETNEVEFLKFAKDPRNLFNAKNEAALLNQASEEAQELPKMADPGLRYAKEGEDTDPHMIRLLQTTGLDKDGMRRLRIKNLVLHRVVNQTRMGKISSIYFLTIAGNQNGLLGIGEGKASEVEDARRQAMMAAIRNMQPVPRYEGRTIFGEVEGKVGAVELKLSTRPPGFGVRCQHLIFEMARAAGISDLAARVTRSRNKMNTVKATFQALMSQRLPEDIARARGKKLVDVRNVYYGGNV